MFLFVFFSILSSKCKIIRFNIIMDLNKLKNVSIVQENDGFYLLFHKNMGNKKMFIGEKYWFAYDLFWTYRDKNEYRLYIFRPNGVLINFARFFEYYCFSDGFIFHGTKEDVWWFVQNGEKVFLGNLFCHIDEFWLFIRYEKVKSGTKIRFYSLRSGNLSSLLADSWFWLDNNTLLLRIGKDDVQLKIR